MTLLYFLICLGASVVGAICGIGGGIVGRMLNRRMDNRAGDRLLMVLMGVIVLICVYNGCTALNG